MNPDIYLSGKYYFFEGNIAVQFSQLISLYLHESVSSNFISLLHSYDGYSLYGNAEEKTKNPHPVTD
jgi:hypothetical protein